MAAGDTVVTDWIDKDNNTLIDSTITALSYASGDSLEYLQNGGYVKAIHVKGA